MNNQEFLDIVAQSFVVFLETGSRSNQKLKIFHGAISNDFQKRLGVLYKIKSLGIGDGKEQLLKGRYFDKKVDITIYKKDLPIAGIGVKFVMQNYCQNANNYFENMLGETANIRANKIPYFQIIIIPEELPYFKKGGEFSKWENVNSHHIEKYLHLSSDNIESFFHTPTKTLLYLVDFPKMKNNPHNSKEYNNFYLNEKDLNVKEATIQYSPFESTVIYNDYEQFVEKVTYYILSI